jgi:type IV pilus assembly protein PilZ
MRNQVEEKRKKARIPLRVKVEYRSLGGFVSDWTDNISEGGLFILTENPLPVGSQVRLVFSLPGLPLMLDLRGRVRWVTSPYGLRSGMGIEFTELGESVRGRIQDYVSQALSVRVRGGEGDFSEEVTQPSGPPASGGRVAKK